MEKTCTTCGRDLCNCFIKVYPDAFGNNYCRECFDTLPDASKVITDLLIPEKNEAGCIAYKTVRLINGGYMMFKQDNAMLRADNERLRVQLTSNAKTISELIWERHELKNEIEQYKNSLHISRLLSARKDKNYGRGQTLTKKLIPIETIVTAGVLLAGLALYLLTR